MRTFIWKSMCKRPLGENRQLTIYTSELKCRRKRTHSFRKGQGKRWPQREPVSRGEVWGLPWEPDCGRWSSYHLLHERWCLLKVLDSLNSKRQQPPSMPLLWKPSALSRLPLSWDHTGSPPGVGPAIWPARANDTCIRQSTILTKNTERAIRMNHGWSSSLF